MSAIARRVCCQCRTCYGLLIAPTIAGKDTHGWCKPCAEAWVRAFRLHQEEAQR